MVKAGAALLLVVIVGSGCPRPGPQVVFTAPPCVVTGQPFSVETHLEDGTTPRAWRYAMGDGTTELITRSSTHVHTYKKAGRFPVRIGAELDDGRTTEAVTEIEAQAGVASCGDRPPPVARRMIHVDACRDHGLLGCLVDMGSLEAGDIADHDVFITNPGTADTRVETLDILGDDGNAFTVEQPERLVVHPDGMDAIRVHLRFTPQPGTYHVARLRIRSNAENLPDGLEDIRVVLTGAALDAPVPRFEVVPTECDFGSVVINDRAECTLTLRNAGTAPVHVVGAVLEGDESITLLDEIPAALELAPMAERRVRAQFRPQAQRPFSAVLRLETTDPASQHVNVALRGVGIEREPIAIPRIETVNGLPVLPGQALRPLDDVVVTGAGSMPGRAGRMITSWRWELVSKPDTSTVELSSPNGVATGFRFNSSNNERAGLDVIGQFVVRLTVTDDGGLTNVNDGTLVLSTAAGRGIHVQLTWEDAFSDIDLHLLRSADMSAAFTGDDCFYSNCTEGGNLNWGGGDRNPTLDIDDTNGFGPENIRLAEAEAGRSYLVGVHFYARGRPQRVDIPARVQIFLDGNPIADLTHVLDRCNTFWSVGVVHPLAPMEWEPRDITTIVDHSSCRD